MYFYSYHFYFIFGAAALTTGFSLLGMESYKPMIAEAFMDLYSFSIADQSSLAVFGHLL